MENKRQLQKKETRRKILDTAYLVFSQKGFSATTELIAKEAGISHGTLFSHFPTKEDLLISLTKEIGEEMKAELQRLIKKGESLEDLLAIQIKVLAKKEDFYIRLISEKELLPEVVNLELWTTQSIVAHHFGILIKTGNYKGIMPAKLFNIWMGMLHYHLQNKKIFSPDEPLLLRYGKEFIGTFLELIQQ